uniref:DNA-directed RNA polymerase subunit beta'' n=1 Tax=Andreaea rupestris var. fauriei TaxID=573743 RepID=A0A8A9Y341_9BRYO|nr:RNA polymerase beta'' subunit [Andreaea rupestris var. fauriei]
MVESAKLLFYNKVMDRTAIKQLISRLIAHFGITYTTHILDQLKTLGFQQATQAAISLGIDDLLTAPSKGWLIQDAEQQGYTSEKHHRYGNVHAVEKLRQLIETWYATSEYLKQEMNPNFRMTDPLNPVHMMSFSGARGSTSQVHQLVGMRGLMSDPQGQIIDLPIQSNFREGLSLTEYIISCYGARKGVVDTAVRTSDAGYLTRRLVEVVQHIVVRKFDCGTVQSIFITPFENSKKNLQINGQQKLIGRVLADNVYINERCIATRNQDITASLANYLITRQVKLISIRSPLICKSMLWICQLCYGWSLTHGNLIELGEAVGIIAGQSIGEPGTQLTLRTFHTGGVFTGDIAEHVRTPFNGIIKFNKNLIYPTRTRHGHPAWICHNNLSVVIKSKNKIHNLVIPSQSVLLVQNNQYVESKQVIAEVRAKISPFKEKVQKYIYSNLEGEMHWSTKVQHASEYAHSNVHLLLTTGHVWILSGNFYKNTGPFFIFYQNQDKINIKLPLAKQNLSYSKIEYIFSNKNWNSIYSNIIFYAYSILQIKKKKKTLFFFGKEKEKYEKKSLFNFMLKIPKNGILQNNDIFAIFDNPKYRIKSSGTIKYGNIKIDLNNKKNEIFKDQRTKIVRPKYKIIKVGNFFFLPEEVYILHQSLSSILVRNNSFVQAGTKITSTIRSQVAGLIKIKRNANNSFEIKILPGRIYYPEETQKFSKQNGIFVPPGEKIFEEFQSKNWIYLQWIVLSKENSFFLVRPAIEYKISNELNNSNLPIPFFFDLLKEHKIIKIKTVEYILYEDGEEIEIINKTGVQLVQSCLVLNWGTKIFIKEAYVSFIKIKINKIIKDFLQINLIQYPNLDVKKKNNIIILKSLFNNKIYSVSPFLNNENLLFSKHQGTIRVLSNRNKEGCSFLTLSPSNSFQTFLFNYTKKNVTIGITENSFKNKLKKNLINFIEKKDLSKKLSSKKITKNFILPIKKTRLTFLKKIGLLGHLQNITKFFQLFYLIEYNPLIPVKFSIIDSLKNKFQNPKWYLLDENKKIHKLLLGKNIIFNLLIWSFPLFFSLKKKFQLINLGQFICEGLSISKYQPFYESGQIIAIHIDFLVIRLAKPYLATGGATVHNNYGEIVKEGDTSITLIYERLKSGDIIQGLPKVEQLLEARPINPVSINLEKGFEDWNKDMTNFFGSLWGFFFSARISMEQSQINLVDQIQKVYESQGVQISNKHIEIIVRQMTSKVLTLEDGMANGFLPGELIEFSRAQRMNRALEEVIPYKPILLGITKASLNTQSFISEASFQETTRVLARAALRGRIDWLKGLKENVILGGIVPAGTGCQEVIWQRTLEKQKTILLKKTKTKLFHNKVKDIFLYEKLSISFNPEMIHKKLKQHLSEINIDRYI